MLRLHFFTFLPPENKFSLGPPHFDAGAATETMNHIHSIKQPCLNGSHNKTDKSSSFN